MSTLAPYRSSYPLPADAPPVRAGGHVSPRRVHTAAALERILGAAERVYAVVLLLVFSSAVLPLLNGSADGAANLEEGDPHRQAIRAALFALALVFTFLRPPGEVFAAALRSPATLLLVGLALASAAWSEFPDITLRRAVAVAGTTFCGFWLAGRFRGREFLPILGWALGIAAVLSVAFAVLLPGLGIHHDELDGAWRGVFQHKNGMGRVMALGTLTFLLLAQRPGASGRRRAYLALAALSVALVLLSRSASSLVALGVLLALVPLYRTLASRSAWLVPAAIAVALPVTALVLFVASDPQAALGLLGKDASLTGRTELWGSAAASLQDRLLGGYGYDAFWQLNAHALTIYAAVGWEPWHAHNGFLDLGLELGVVGIVLFAAAFFGAVRRATGAVLAGAREEGLWMLSFLSFMLLGNLTESSILAQNLHWLLFVATAAMAVGVPAPAAAPAGPRTRLSPGVRLRARRRPGARAAAGEG
ncbi:MAG TPA: O-antigen ligase family protein [Longimicrobium sp.]|jgi:O-antigen ligase